MLIWRSILLFFLGLFANKYYDHRYVCDDAGTRCVTIAHETGASFNSSTETYVFIGKYQAIPSIDKKYLKFEDGVEVCVLHEADGKIHVYYRYPPIINTIDAELILEDWDAAPKNCVWH